MMRSLFQLLAVAFALTLIARSAVAVTIEVEKPASTSLGQATQLSAQISGETGEALVRWDFGDGEQLDFSSGQQTVEHTYAKSGHYAVIVLVQDEVAFSSFSFVHTVHTPLTEGTPRASSSMAYDPARHLIAVANPDNDTVTLVDSLQLTKIAEIEVDDQPESVAFLPDGTLWVLHQANAGLAIVDVELREIVERVQLPHGSMPTGLVVSPLGPVYVSLMATGQVARIDPEERSIEELIEAGPWPRGLAVNHDGSKLYVTRFISGGGEGQVTILDLGVGGGSAVVALPEDTTTEDTDQKGRGLPNYLFSVQISPDGREAWVPGKKDNVSRGLKRDGLALTQDNTVRPMVAVLDLLDAAEDLESRMDLDDRNLPAHVTFSPFGDYAFVSLIGSSMVEVRDTYTKDFVTVLRDTGFAPRASLLSEEGRLFVHAGLSRNLAVFDVSKILSGEEQLAKKLADVSLVDHETLNETVLRGKQVFYDSEDKRMTREGYISCASCHFEGFEDGRVWDFSDRGEGFRNTTSLLGRGGMGQGRLHWSGNFDEVQDFEGAIRNDFGGTGFLTDEAYAEGDRSSPLGLPKAGLSPELDALASYVSSLNSFPQSPYKNSDGSLTEAAERGMRLFDDLGCGSCHAGQSFTNSATGSSYDIGTLKETSGSRLGDPLTGIDTPTLLGIWQTAPYLHDGSAETLEDVLIAENPNELHGETHMLNGDALDDLVKYLKQLDGWSVAIEEPDQVTEEPPLGEAPLSNAQASGCAWSGSRPPGLATPFWIILAGSVLTWLRSRRSPEKRTTHEF